MSLEDLIGKNKIKADDYIIIFMIGSYLLFALFFHLEALVCIIFYPFASLGICGVLKIINALNKRNHGGHVNENMILVGIIYIILSILFSTFILSQPNITSHIVISIISYPLLVVGCAGIIKGMLIEIYSIRYRIINILIGLFTIIVCSFAFFSVVSSLLINMIIFSIVFFLNVLSRAALYLSEYGLSLRHLTNLKLFFYIISDYIICIDANGDVVLSKINLTI
ncbi:MAG: hypothetical protein ACFFCE_16535 [Promethearchaeota archaeon]